MNVLGIIVNGHWKPGIGDPTFIGWLTTGLYSIATVLCGIYAWQMKKNPTVGFHHCLFWSVLFIFLLFLSVNKQLDLQTLFMLTGRNIARAQGWYSYRDAVRMWFIVLFSIFCFLLIFSLIWIFRYALSEYGLALIGLALIIIYIVIRAGANHIHIFGWDPGVSDLNWILEIGGICLIILSTITGILQNKKHQSKE